MTIPTANASETLNQKSTPTPPPSDVCYVNENGVLVCGDSGPRPTGADAVERALRSILRDIPPDRLDLAVYLALEVFNSPLDDKCIGHRHRDVVDSVHQLLRSNPPSMLLYRYATVPGDIMATYDIVNKKDYGAARQALDYFAVPKPAC